MQRILPYALALLFAGLPLFAQDTPNPETETLRPPALLVRTSPDDPAKPLAVRAVHYRLSVIGRLARCEVDLTFYNHLDRILEGQLVLPLPDGGTITGYALEIEGVLRQGVVVERERARVVFEEIVRRNVDPGLVEWVQGNVFRTRVYPVPAKGTKRCILTYEWEIGDRVVLPLQFGGRVGQLGIEIEADGTTLDLRKSPPGFELPMAAEGRLSARFRAEEVEPETDLILTFAPVTEPLVMVEEGHQGRVFHATIPIPTTGDGPVELKRLVVAYDVSNSRAGAALAKERQLLEALVQQAGVEQITLVPFAATMGTPSTFDTSTAEGEAALLAALEQLSFDGGTRLAVLEELAGHGTDALIIFTDGMTTFGSQLPTLGGRTHVVVSQGTRDRSVLEAMVPGHLIDLTDASPEEGATRLVQAHLYVIGVSGDGLTDVVTALDGETLRVAGRVAGDNPVRVTCQLGRRGQRLTEIIEVGSVTSKGSRIDRTWARMRVQQLVPHEAHREAIQKVGLTYGIVTPETSLLVLETLDDYVRYRVRPPQEWVEEWGERLEVLEVERQQTRTEKLAWLRTEWKKRVEWWEKEFEIDPAFRYREANKEESGATGEGGRPMEREAPDSAAPPAAPSPSLDFAEEVPARGDTEGKMKENAKGGQGIALKPWTPDVPYLAALQEAGEGAWEVYLRHKQDYGRSSAFFLDVADFFEAQDQHERALQVLSNVAELDLGSARLLRILAHRLAQMDELELAVEIFTQIRRMRPEEPQSHRDLALVLARLERWEEAIPAMERVVLGDWDGRFPEIELYALGELNRMIVRCKEAGGESPHTIPDDLVHLLDAELRVTLSWDADNCDMDLWVIEPSGERAFYSHTRTHTGGWFGRDFTGGYGPEEYWVKQAMPGTFQIKVKYYGNRQQLLAGATTIQVEIVKNWGRPGEERIAVTRRLRDVEEVLEIAEVHFEGAGAEEPAGEEDR